LWILVIAIANRSTLRRTEQVLQGIAANSYRDIGDRKPVIVEKQLAIRTAADNKIWRQVFRD
jgi:hypothetical protein